MNDRGNQDIIAGSFLIVVGVFAAVYSVYYLDLGTGRRPGPGMFPASIGALLCVLGVAILLPAIFRGARLPPVDYGSAAATLGAIFAFALLLQPLGLVPAILMLTLIVSRASGKLTFRGNIVLASGLSLFSVIAFRFGLGLQFELLNWPW
jgi:Tripartite tricarboxylate transporter TctB family